MSSLQNVADVANVSTDVTDIKAVTDLLPDAGALTSIAQNATVALDATVAKAATVALDATVAKEATLTVPVADAAANVNARDVTGNKTDAASDTIGVASLIALIRKTLDEAKETEQHIHNYERWIGPAAVPSGENHVADPLGEPGGAPAGVITSFQFTSGPNNTWGPAVQIFGATDAAVCLPSGLQAFYDLHRLRPTDAEEDKRDWIIRIIEGTSAAAGVAADTYLVVPMFMEKSTKVPLPVELIDERVPAGTKHWAQVLLTTNNNEETLDLQFGLHGYPE